MLRIPLSSAPVVSFTSSAPSYSNPEKSTSRPGPTNAVVVPGSHRALFMGTQPLRFGRSLAPNGEFELALSEARLDDILQTKTRVLTLEQPQTYESLSPANQKALVHLVRAAHILDDVFLKQDHPDSLRARDLLEQAAATGDTHADKTLQLFRMFNGMQGYDLYANEPTPLHLFKDKQLQPGKGFYPPDLTQDELVKYIKAHPEQAAGILSNNTIVQREGDRLVAIPYSVAFRTEFEAAASALLAAAQATDHAGLAEYLRWQAQALVNDSDPEMVFNAEKTWIGLDDAPLDFTIGRESYKDTFSTQIAEDSAIKALLNTHHIQAKKKDAFAIRVGIVNPDSNKQIEFYAKNLEAFSHQMPFAKQYKQTLGKMTYVDLDLVAYKGEYAALGGGSTYIAQNLPNPDKLSAQLNTGSRLAFHRQVHRDKTLFSTQKRMKHLIDPTQADWNDFDAATFPRLLGHEVGHSLGPSKTRGGKNIVASLGKWGATLEENKADMVSLLMANYLTRKGHLTQDHHHKIAMTWALKQTPQKKPPADQSHRLRELIQFNYFKEHGAIDFELGDTLKIHPEKFSAVATQMLTEVIQLQLDGDADKAGDFVKQYTQWNDTLQYAVDEQSKLNPKRYLRVEQPFMEHLLAASPDAV